MKITKAEQWQRVRPVPFHYGEFMQRLGRVDDQCIFKLVDDGVTIFFSDGSSYRWSDPQDVIVNRVEP
jgi:hypothetical protein